MKTETLLEDNDNNILICYVACTKYYQYYEMSRINFMI